ncbi:MAG TPA: VRR-NUC domain-containing protein [Gammaproteobacteria bacterium]|nr:VRR-NUC domain-containing protein [Gammaproteobacteria bacterium]
MTRITPEQLAASGSESGEQKAVFCWASMPEQLQRYGPLLQWMHAIPNGGKRDSVTAARMRAEGVKAGVADIFLPVPARPITATVRFCGLYIEMKRKNGKPSDISDEQKEFRDFVTANGYAWVCCFGWRHAAATIEAYLHEFVTHST